MAITPDEARNLAGPPQQEIEALERVIDAGLIANMRRGENKFHIAYTKFPTRAHFNKIKIIYTKKGWSVVYNTDQRDGDFITFQER